MELAKVTSKGQITIPISIRKELGIKDGDKVIFLKQGDNIVIANSALIALRKAQDAFKGEADRLGLEDEQDIVDMVNEVRNDLSKEYMK